MVFSRYEARGNVYVVATPDEVFGASDARRTNATAAALSAHEWSRTAVRHLCSSERWDSAKSGEAIASDGLLIGPFSTKSPFDLLIVNTDGSLAERSGNGLTIFAHFLRDKLPERSGKRSYPLLVRSVRSTDAGALHTVESVAVRGNSSGIEGYTVDMGRPNFGARYVGVDLVLPTGRSGIGNLIDPLCTLDSRWHSSVLVEIGNPHCVTMVTPSRVPTFVELTDERLHQDLKAIAFAPGAPGHGYFPRGINLQWAGVVDKGVRGRKDLPAVIRASVFERGEGATLSSGSSAVAVACACLKAGLIEASDVLVDMPGGRMPIELVLAADDSIERAFLFGVATETPET